MTTEIQQKFKDVFAAVNSEHYYPQLFSNAMLEHNMDPDGVNNFEYDDKKIVLMINDFWEALPDSPSIRRPPFFQVCDIAENIFEE